MLSYARSASTYAGVDCHSACGLMFKDRHAWSGKPSCIQSGLQQRLPFVVSTSAVTRGLLFAAMVDALDCLSDNARVHIYGLPWRAKVKEGLDNPHDDPEAALVRQAAVWKVVIHEMMLPAPPATAPRNVSVPVEMDVQEHQAVTSMQAGERAAGVSPAGQLERPPTASNI